ncbi:L,D-transpeptidase [Xanthobacter sp. KR7-225]|uniref:L,D-transpeptidase n=1 Tax=Xanthobacter sp. KR7-225 TaxID=3156613 RepID=UPI0032B4F53B
MKRWAEHWGERLTQALRRFSLAGLILALCGFAAAAEASVVARIDLSSQRMTVTVNGIPSYSWPVSTARRGYVTPTGSYRPQRMYRSYFSRKYYNSPMPYSIFFRGGYAIHGSYAVNQLGTPASHGCIRLHPANAATLYSLVQSHGAGNTVILITY